MADLDTIEYVDFYHKISPSPDLCEPGTDGSNMRFVKNMNDQIRARSMGTFLVDRTFEDPPSKRRCTRTTNNVAAQTP